MKLNRDDKRDNDDFGKLFHYNNKLIKTENNKAIVRIMLYME